MAELDALVQRIEFSAQGLAATQQSVSAAMSQIGSATDAASEKSSKLGPALMGSMKAVGGVASTVAKDALNVGGALATSVSVATASLAGIGVKANSELETAQLQFETLLGSSDKAKERVASLFDFAKKTPFETGPIIQASRIMQTFGGDALASEKNLQLVGDAAAGTSQGIEDVGFWVSRAYAAIKGGQPFGEAAARLQEMAILTPEAAQKMRDLQESGASADEVFGVLQSSMGKFGGGMDKLAGTFTGLRSTLSDTIQLGAAEAFKPLFDSIKKVMQALIDFSNTPAFDAIIQGIAGLAANAVKYIDLIAPAISKIGSGLDVGKIGDLFNHISDGADGLSKTLGPLVPLVASVGGAFLSMKAGAIPILGSFIPAISPVTAALGGLLLTTDAGKDAMSKMGDAFQHAAKTAFPPLLDGAKVLATSLSEGLGAAFDALAPAIEDVAEVLGPVLGQAMEDLAPVLGELIGAFGKLVAQALPPLAGLLAGLIGPITSLATGALPILTGLLELAADNMDLLIPAIAGVAGAIATLKFANMIADLGGMTGALTAAKGGVENWVLSLAGATGPQGIGAVGGAAKTVAADIEGVGDAATKAVGGGSTGLAGMAGITGPVMLGMLGVGVAIAGVTAYMAYQARAAKDARDAQASYAGEIDKTGSTLVGASHGLQQWLDGTTAAEHEMSGATNEVKGVNEAFERMGVGVDEAAGKLTGSNAQWQTFKTTLTNTLADIYAQKQGFDDLADAQEKDGMKAEFIVRQAGETANALEKQRGAVKGAEEAHDANARAMYREVTASELAHDKQRLLTEAYANGVGRILEMEQLNIAQAANQRAVGEAFKESAGSMDINTEAGARARTSLITAAEGARAFADGLIAQGVPLDEVNKKTNDYVNGLVLTAVAAGASDEEVKGYLGTLGLTPEQVSTYIDAKNTEEANKKADDFRKRVDEIPPDKRTEFLANVDNGRLLQAQKQLDDAAHARIVQFYAGAIASSAKAESLGIAKAIGGPVKAGDPYWVGERGPELIFPTQDGIVMPADLSKSFVDVASTSGRRAEVATAQAPARGGPAVAINNAVFQDQVDLDLLFARADRRKRAGRP